jgi:hypothetical protein
MKIVFLMILFSGCSFFTGIKESPKTAKGSRYSISFNESEWVQKNDQRSDFIFENKKDGRILLSNSFCDEFQGSSLEQIGLKTFRNIKEFKITLSKYDSFHDRESFRLDASGLMDGVKVTLQLLNTRRDNCYFDFLSINPEGTNTHSSDFEKFLNSVIFK